MSTPQPRPSRLPRVLLGLAAFVAGGIGFLVLTGDRLPSLDAEALARARASWRERAPGRYRMTVEVDGSELGRGVYRIEVAPDRPPRTLRDGAPVGGDPRAWTVDGMLELLERELELAASPQGAFGAPPGYRVWLTARFDASRGIPLRYRRLVGGGSGRWVEWRVTSFEG